MPTATAHEHTHAHAAIRVDLPTMSESALRAWLQMLPRDIIRIKGFTRIDGREGGCFFQRTDDEHERPTLAFSQGSNLPPCCAVLIGGNAIDREPIALKFLTLAMRK